ncbi:ThuA domain-containing protein [Micromonospora sp. NPDC047074]|uniref:ThuA domain-containing protein n=1 Tax=Micromonospora sp. NPDC047074 TaxID=3154339 RepID=UPI0033DEB6AF
MSFEIIVFSRTAGFRHDSIGDGVRAVQWLGREHDFTVTATEDAGLFTPDRLAEVAAVVFLNTSGEVLDAAQQRAFESYIGNGGGYVGVHAAATTGYSWPFYGRLVGAYFVDHPEVQRATIRVEDHDHPATAHLGATWIRRDEWYNHRCSVRPAARVLLSVDEASYHGGTMGVDHPHAWCAEVAGGRSFYTAGGHTSESYDEPDFRTHLLGGIRWAAGGRSGVDDAPVAG